MWGIDAAVTVALHFRIADLLMKSLREVEGFSVFSEILEPQGIAQLFEAFHLLRE